MDESRKKLLFYHEVVSVTRAYLGPAAERFIDRQVTNHLHKEPEALEPGDLHKLIDWIRVALSLITEDTRVVEEYSEKLQELIMNAEVHKEHHGSKH